MPISAVTKPFTEATGAEIHVSTKYTPQINPKVRKYAIAVAISSGVSVIALVTGVALLILQRVGGFSFPPAAMYGLNGGGGTGLFLAFAVTVSTVIKHDRITRPAEKSFVDNIDVGVCTQIFVNLEREYDKSGAALYSVRQARDNPKISGAIFEVSKLKGEQNYKRRVFLIGCSAGDKSSELMVKFISNTYTPSCQELSQMDLMNNLVRPTQATV
jgi:hypothetical protein